MGLLPLHCKSIKTDLNIEQIKTIGDKDMGAVYIVVMERTLQGVNLITEAEAFSTLNLAKKYVNDCKDRHLQDKMWFKERKHFVEELEEVEYDGLYIADMSEKYTVTLRIVPKLVK